MSKTDNDRKNLWELMNLQVTLNNSLLLLKKNPNDENIKIIRKIQKLLKKIDNDIIVYSRLLNTKPRKRSGAVSGFRKHSRKSKNKKCSCISGFKKQSRKSKKKKCSCISGFRKHSRKSKKKKC